MNTDAAVTTGTKRRPSDQTLVTVAVLINEQVPDPDIAAAFGVSQRTLRRWKTYPEMQLLAEAFLIQWKRRHWKQEGMVSAGEFAGDRLSRMTPIGAIGQVRVPRWYKIPDQFTFQRLTA